MREAVADPRLAGEAPGPRPGGPSPHAGAAPAGAGGGASAGLHGPFGARPATRGGEGHSLGGFYESQASAESPGPWGAYPASPPKTAPVQVRPAPPRPPDAGPLLAGHRGGRLPPPPANPRGGRLTPAVHRQGVNGPRPRQRRNHALRNMSAGPRPSGKYPEIEGPSNVVLRRAQTAAPGGRGFSARRPGSTGRGATPFAAGVTGRGGLSLSGKHGEIRWGKYGGRYQGGLLGGRPHGYGCYWALKGATGPLHLAYEGYWVHGKKGGKGKVYSLAGEVFVGHFLHDEKHGPGRQQMLNGDIFAGDYAAGKKEGMGVHMRSNGDAFVGTYINDLKEGLGTYYWASKGTKYVGEWVKGQARSGSIEAFHTRELEEVVARVHGEDSRALTPRAKKRHNLPKLSLRNPNKVVFDQWVGVRGERAQTPRGRNPRADGGDATLTKSQMEHLRHSFIALAGGEDEHHQISVGQLPSLCLAAGLDPVDPVCEKLIKTLQSSCLETWSELLSYERFLVNLTRFRAPGVG